jgi:uncharacterized protein (TIGR00288 family)
LNDNNREKGSYTLAKITVMSIQEHMESTKKIAVLIDYDNFNQDKYISILFDELNELGVILIKYAYYSSLGDATIKEKFIKHGIQPMSQLAYSKGKNAVDIRMTIEAMSLLDKEYIDTICLATNDSDFMPLVVHLKLNNKYVIGAGDNKATETYKNAFNTFISVEKISESINSENNVDNVIDLSIDILVKTVNEIIETNQNEKGQSDFSYVVQSLKDKMKDFNPKNYGAKNKQALPFFQLVLKKYYDIKKLGSIYYISVVQAKK